MRFLVNDRSVVINKADKGSCAVVWYREDHIAQAERQVEDVTIYKDVNFKEEMLQNLAKTSNKLFKTLKVKEESQKNNCSFLPTNLGKLYLLPRFISSYLKFQVGQSIHTVVLLQKNFLSFWKVSLNWLCKKVRRT